MEAFEKTRTARAAQWEALNLPSAEIEHLLATTGYRTRRLPSRSTAAAKSQTLDAKVKLRKSCSANSSRPTWAGSRSGRSRTLGITS
ncbi:hypothetical protein ACTMU2_10595 [Cupriavidus basilensis]